jgi:hypothetical protein
MLQGAVRWLARQKPALMVRGDGVYPLALRKDLDDGRTLLGLFNLTLDPWTDVEFELASRRQPGAIEVLTPAGAWEPARAAGAKRVGARKVGGRVHVTWREPVPFDQPLFLTVGWK